MCQDAATSKTSNIKTHQLAVPKFPKPYHFVKSVKDIEFYVSKLQKWVAGVLRGNSLVVRRVSPGGIIVVLFRGKCAVPRQIKPRILGIVKSALAGRQIARNMNELIQEKSHIHIHASTVQSTQSVIKLQETWSNTRNISNSFPFATNICFSRFQAGAAVNCT